MPNQSDLSSGAPAKLDPTQTDPVQTPVVPPVDNNPPIVVPDFQAIDMPDLPPMPEDSQQPIANISQTTEPINEPAPGQPADPINESTNQLNTDTGSAAPIDDSTLGDTSGMMVSPPPKKKFGGGKIIATILGLFLLVGGIAGGVLLTKQNQNVNEKAAVQDEPCNEVGACGGLAGAQQECAAKGDRCKWINAGQTQVCPDNSGQHKCADCVLHSVPGKCVGATPPPAPTASCQGVKAYSTTWALLNATQLSALKVGDQVNFCATGATTPVQDQVQFTAARFKINGTDRPETTAKRPGGSPNEFCDLYTIPAATTTFNVSAQVKILNQWK